MVNNTKFVHWLLHLVQRGGAWAGWGPAQSLLTVPNVTAHPSTASVPVTVLLYGPLLCSFNVAIKGLKPSESFRFVVDYCCHCRCGPVNCTMTYQYAL